MGEIMIRQEANRSMEAAQSYMRYLWIVLLIFLTLCGPVEDAFNLQRNSQRDFQWY